MAWGVFLLGNPQTESSNLKCSQDKTHAWMSVSGLQMTPVSWVVSQCAVVAGQGTRALIVPSIHGKGHSTAEAIELALPGEQQSPPHRYRLRLVISTIPDSRHHGQYRHSTTALFRSAKRCCCHQEDALSPE